MQHSSKKLTIAEMVNKNPASYRIRRFVTVLTTACHRLLSCARWIQSTTSHPVSL